MHRSQITIPVNKDGRSFEQQESDWVTDIESSFKRESQSDFFAEAHRAMQDRRRQWDDEMRSFRENFFALKSGDDAFGRSLFGSAGDFPDFSSNKSIEDKNYEPGADGNLHYKSRFDVKKFNAEDIAVRVDGSTVHIQAKSKHTTPNSSSEVEYSRSVQLPSDVKTTDISSILSSDGILTVDAPVAAPAYKAPKPIGGGGIESSFGGASSRFGLQSRLRSDGGWKQDGQGMSVYEVDLGDAYAPEDIDVEVKGSTLKMSGNKKVTTGGCVSSRSVSREISLPSNIEPTTLSTSLLGNILYLKACIKEKTVASTSNGAQKINITFK